MGVRRVAVIACFALACAMLMAGTSLAASGGGFSVRPAHNDPADPATRAYFKHSAAAGTTFSDDVVVTAGNRAVTLHVYPVDGLTGQTSGSVYGNRDDELKKAGLWVTPATSTISLAASKTATVRFTVHVPAEATVGDHLAGIAFENVDTQTSGGKFSVKEVVRMVVGIQIIVPGSGSPHFTLGHVAIQQLGGTGLASIVVGLTNDGAKLCKPVVTIGARGPNGYTKTINRQLDTVLPGDTIDYPFAWPDTLARGAYDLDVQAECGDVRATTHASASLGVSLTGVEATPKPVSTPAPRSGIPPWMLGLVGAAGLGVGLIVSRKRKSEPEKNDAPAPEPEREPVGSRS